VIGLILAVWKGVLSVADIFMKKIGIFFGTDSGTTRLMAKKIAMKLGEDIAGKPLNVNRIEADDLLQYDALILGTPSYGEGDLPGIATGVKDGSWQEFVPKLAGADMSGKTVALYGLGNQEKYPQRFVDSLYQLYELFTHCGATIIGDWSTEGYTFEHSKAVIDERFVGLVIDHNSQGLLTEARLDAWLAEVKPALLKAVQ
jgi:flavodoxin I